MKLPIIEDTYAEAFNTKVAHPLITAATKNLAYTAVTEATEFATSFNRISCRGRNWSKYISPEKTHDNRPGYSIIICQNKKEDVEEQLLERIGQCVLTTATISVFNLLPDCDGMTNLGFKLAFFADGYQENRKIW